MATKETRIVWVTKDGKEFDNEYMAEQHEVRQHLTTQLSNAIHWRDVIPEEVADWLLKNYKLIPLENKP